MALTKENLRQLLQLQEQDRVLDCLQASINQIPVQIQSLQGTLDSDKSRVAEAKNKSTRLQLAKKEKELSLSQKEEAIRKHGMELNQVRTNDAYRALQAEIDMAKAEVSDLETAILTFMEEMDQLAREEKSAAAALKESEVRIQREIQSLEAQKMELLAKLEGEKAKRDTLTPGIPAQAMKIYDHLRKRKQGQALAVVKGNICGACRITLMPQSLIEIAKGTTLVACEACQRILYSPDILQEAPVAKSESGS